MWCASVLRPARRRERLLSSAEADAGHAVPRTLAAVLMVMAGAGCLTGPREGVGTHPVFPIRHDAPAWSSQNRIAFRDNGVACVGAGGGFRVDPARVGIWVLDLETREEELVVPGGDLPAWSPDGDTLAFVGGAQIYTAPLTGGTLRQMTSTGQNAVCAWSPDGRWIAYESTAGDRRGNYRIWIMRSDGSDKANISRNAVEWRSPHWSPDGERIFHVRLLPSGRTEIFSMDRAGSNEIQFTDNEVAETDPRVSPDGSRLVFVRQGQLFLACGDGTGVRLLSANPASRPAWSPDGSRILFVRWDRRSNDPANGVLWVIDVASGEETQLTWADRALCE